MYGVPVWIEELEKECNKTIYNRVQRLKNIKIAIAYRTTSNEALRTLTGLTPIVIQAEEAAKLYTMRNSQAQETDHEVQPKDWLHPADSVRVTEQQDEPAIQVFTYGSKSENGVGAGIAIFIQSKLVHQLRYTLHNTCSNNQTEQLAIVKALEKIGKLHINDNIPRTETVHTDSRITLQSLKNTKKSQIPHRRNQEDSNSTRETQLDNNIHLDNAGIYGNELADKLAKEAAIKDNILQQNPQK
jgi:ribonuclease HI